MRALVPTILSLLAITVFAGCLSDEAPVQTSPEIPVVMSVPSGPDHFAPDIPLPEGVAPGVQASSVSGGAEPAVLVRDDASAIFVGDTSGIWRSTNGGQSWQRANPSILRVALADGWALAEDDSGAIYAAGLAEARLQVSRSANNGVSWDLVTPMIPDAVGAVPDRPWIAARDDGVVALIYNDSGATTHCEISTDGGMTFVDHKPVSGAPISGGTVWDGTTLYYTGGDGQVYRVAQSPLAAQGAPVQCLTGGGSYDLFPWILGQTGQLQVAVEDAKAYIAAPSASNAEMIVAGTENYLGLPRTVTVSPAGLASNTFGTIEIENGRIAVAWLGSTTAGNPNNGNFNGAWNVFVATIDDFWGAAPVVNVYQVTSSPMHVGDICMNGIGCGSGQDRDLLDYMDLDFAPNGDIHVVWTHDGTGSSTTVMHGVVTPA